MERVVPFYVTGAKSYNVRLDVEVDGDDYWLSPAQIAVLTDLREWALALVADSSDLDDDFWESANFHGGAWHATDSTVVPLRFVSTALLHA